MTKDELEKLNAALEMILNAVGQMNKNEKNGSWEMPSEVRDAICVVGHWVAVPIVRSALGLPFHKYPWE